MIPETAVPRAGPVVAHFSLGEAFKRIGSEADARRVLALAADAAPENETDRITLPFAISTLISVLGDSESDRAEIRRRFKQFLTIPRTTESDALFARLMFAQDQGPSAPTDGGLRLDALVTSLDHALAEAHVSSDFWRAEVLGGRARLGKVRGEDRKRIVWLWSEALTKARAGKNSRILLQSGQALGFEFAEHARSFLQLANYQFDCLRAAELEGVTSFEFLGANLFTVWSRLDYRRLSENDLEANRMLRDSAIAMSQAALPLTIAGPAMVLLLARLNDQQGSSTEWARQQLAGHLDRLPRDVAARLEGEPGS